MTKNILIQKAHTQPCTAWQRQSDSYPECLSWRPPLPFGLLVWTSVPRSSDRWVLASLHSLCPSPPVYCSNTHQSFTNTHTSWLGINRSRWSRECSNRLTTTCRGKIYLFATLEWGEVQATRNQENVWREVEEDTDEPKGCTRSWKCSRSWKEWEERKRRLFQMFWAAYVKQWQPDVELMLFVSCGGFGMVQLWWIKTQLMAVCLDWATSLVLIRRLYIVQIETLWSSGRKADQHYKELAPGRASGQWK